MIRNQVSNLYPSAKVDTVNLVDFQCNANWVYTQNHAEPRGSITYHHISSHIVTYHHISSHIITWSPDFQATTTGKPIGSQAEPHTASSWQPQHDHHEGNVGNVLAETRVDPGWPVLTQDDPCWPRRIHGKLRTFENPRVKSTNQLTSWVHSCRSPQGVHSIQHTKVYKDNMKGTCQRLTLLC